MSRKDFFQEAFMGAAPDKTRAMDLAEYCANNPANYNNCIVETIMEEGFSGPEIDALLHSINN